MPGLPTRLALITLSLLLVAGGGGFGASGLPDRVWPPRTSLQELQRLPDGDWLVTIRLKSFSTVSVRYLTLQGELTVDGQPAGTFELHPELRLGPQMAEPLPVRLTPTPRAAEALRLALEAGRPIRYAVTGEAIADEPRGRWPQEFDGVLTPVPGLENVLR